MTYQQTLEYIKELQSLGSKPGLSRVTELARLMGNPQDELKIVHVTGTNGKGSVCAMIEAVLIDAGYRTGRFSSPWIEKINEYFFFCGSAATDEEFAKVITDVKKLADKMADTPTEFEVITAAAFEFFKRKKCDIVIVETGMGGLEDATNFISSPVLSVITNISIDHTNYLGDGIKQIAEHKAGIIKPSIPVLFGGEEETALKIIEKEAEEKKSDFYVTDKANIISSDLTGSLFEYRGLEVKLSLLGEYQLQNAATAIDALDILSSCGFNISDENIVCGLKNVKWKGRFEILKENPLFIFDGGHNMQGILYSVMSIKKYFDEKVNILTGVLADKEYEKMATVLSAVAENVFTVTPDNPRALNAEKYAGVFGAKGVKAIACGSISDGVKKALELSKKENRPLVAIGSLYMYKDIKKASS